MLAPIGWAMAQNLVPNPGFEDYSNCPPFWSEKPADLTATHWESPTSATPDNFVTCSSLSGIPKNWAGWMPARTGNAYAGLIARRNFGRSTDDKQNKTHREYLLTPLSQPLQRGALYKVTYYVALAENCRIASDEIGAYFSRKRPTQSSKVKLPYTSQITNTTGVIASTTTWTKIEGTFRADGGEQFMTLGNFKSNSGAKTQEVNMPIRNEGKEFWFSYYFIDDISVVKIGEPLEEPEEEKPVATTTQPEKTTPASATTPTTTSTPATTSSTSTGNYAETVNEATVLNNNATAKFADDHDHDHPEEPKRTGAIVKDFKCECSICRTDVRTILYPSVELYEVDSAHYREGQRIKLDGVVFIEKTGDLNMDESKKTLDLLVFLLSEMPDTEIELVIHMNALGNEEKNRELSKATAATMYNYLRSRGVDNKILYNGFGHKVIPPVNGQKRDRTLELIIRKI